MSNSKTPVTGKKNDTEIIQVGQSEAKLCKFQISRFLKNHSNLANPELTKDLVRHNFKGFPMRIFLGLQNEKEMGDSYRI